MGPRTRTADWTVPIVARPLTVNLSPGLPTDINRFRSNAMTDPHLADALDRAERALARIEAIANRAASGRGRDDALRDKVRGVVAELDHMIRAAGAR